LSSDDFWTREEVDQEREEHERNVKEIGLYWKSAIISVALFGVLSIFFLRETSWTLLAVSIAALLASGYCAWKSWKLKKHLDEDVKLFPWIVDRQDFSWRDEQKDHNK